MHSFHGSGGAGAKGDTVIGPGGASTWTVDTSEGVTLVTTGSGTYTFDGVDTIDGVAARLFEYIRQTASGEIQTKAEQVKHREFQVWSEQAVSL